MKKHLLILLTAVATLLLGCKGNNNTPDNPEDRTILESHDNTATMYVGITGFNNKLYFYTGDQNRRYDILNEFTLGGYKEFVNSLSMAKNTSLFYAVDDNINHLPHCQFPDDIENISIVTFTDGLENGSGEYDNRFIDIEDYEKNLDYINNKIASTSVQGIKLTAYSVGVKGNDVKNETRFNNTLVKLSSGSGYNNNVTDISKLNETFKKIADDLYKQNSKPQLTVAVPPQVRKERIVFDQKDANDSKIYIEATKLKDSPLKYSNITYVGCRSESGSEVQGYKNDEGSTVFLFENFTDENGNKLNYTRTDLWYWDGTGWAPDAEYDGQNGAKTEEVHKSAAIMLILDCSQSLEEQNRFAVVKSAAIKFLEILASSSSSSGTDNPGGGDNPSGTNYYIKHPWGSGADAAWAWKQMTKSGNNYVYEGLWGGVGANINDKASDNGAKWFASSSISGASSLSIGDGVKFTYNPSNATLSATKTSSGSTTATTSRVRFRKEAAYSWITNMSIDRFDSNDNWVETLAEYEFGGNSGTSSYFEIPAGKSVPMYYDNDDSKYYYVLDGMYYTFEAGKKYTYSCGDDGSYLTFTITVDGTFSAPEGCRVVAQRRILKSELRNQRKIRK